MTSNQIGSPLIGLAARGPFLAWLLKREITPHIPVLDRKHQTMSKYDLSHFQYDPKRGSYTCLEGLELKLRSADENTKVKRYRSTTKICGGCPIRKACTDAPLRNNHPPQGRGNPPNRVGIAA
ncbi:MAG: hypothetical protein WBB25_16680 [Sulfitobacter sp.]